MSKQTLTQRVKELEAKLFEAEAHNLMNLKDAHTRLDKMSNSVMLGSGVVITIQSISGKQLIAPFLVADGLDQATIEHLKNDIKRTIDLRVSLSKIDRLVA